MSDEIKKLGPEGVSALWGKVFELVKLLTGDVDTSKGTLQEQIDSILAGGVSGTSGVKEISLADYEALSEEEKNNGTAYFIPDATPVTTDGITFTVEDGILTAVYDDGEESEE